MRDGLVVGHRSQIIRPVGPQQCIVLGGRAAVFSTPAMIDLMEHAARAALGPFLGDGEESVGVDVAVTHLSATPIASVVRGEARVSAIDGRTVSFDIEAHDQAGVIGRGTHRRAIVQMDRFAQRLEQRTPAAQTLLEHPLEANTGPLPPLEAVTFTAKDGLGWLTLSRPNALNAISRGMTADLRHLVEWLAAHGDQIGAVIVTGAGKAFCAGVDLKEMAQAEPRDLEQWNLDLAQALRCLGMLPQPLIAAINGHAIGGGFMLACSCDLRIAIRGAALGLPEAKLGWPPSFGLATASACVGIARTMELALTGQAVSAEQAVEAGLVSQVVPPLMLARRAEELGRQILSMPRQAVGQTKRLIQQLRPLLAADAMAHLAYMQCLTTPQAQASVKAFAEKRPAGRGK